MLRSLIKNKEELTVGWFTNTEEDDSVIRRIRKGDLVGIKLIFKGNEKPRDYNVDFDEIEFLNLKIKKDEM